MLTPFELAEIYVIVWIDSSIDTFSNRRGRCIYPSLNLQIISNLFNMQMITLLVEHADVHAIGWTADDQACWWSRY